MRSRRTGFGFFAFIVLLCLGLIVASGFVSFLIGFPSLSPRVLASPVNYDFTVNNETCHVFVEKDGSITINYSITFTNYGTDFDYIDIGFPNSYYSLSSVKAYWSLAGAAFVELTNIAPSTVIDIGVEIFVPTYLRPGSGQNGTLLVWGNNPHMVYRDTEHTDYAGIEFSPTWFGSQYCRLVEVFDLHIHFPEGFKNGTMAYYHHNQYTRYYHTNSSLVYVWEWRNETPRQHTEGVSFPGIYVDVIYDPPTTTETPFTTTYPPLTSYWGFDYAISQMIFFGIIFAMFISIPLVACALSARASGHRLRRRKYLPPAAKVESFGVRRGLTVVEAAILNETPLESVFTMIIFGMLKKGLIEMQPGPSKRPLFRAIPSAIEKNTRYYERLFLASIKPNGTLNRAFIKRMLKALIKTTVRKMEGYSRVITKAYYRQMIARGWEEMSLAITPDQQQHVFHEYAEWLLLDPVYEKRIQHYPTWYVPTWYIHFHTATSPLHQPPPTHPHTPTVPATIIGPPSPLTGQLPTIHTTTLPPLSGPPISVTNFANTFVIGTQNLANIVVTGFQNIANAIVFLFNPPPRPIHSSSGSSGGGGFGGGGGSSCACACACASCACACAGGGR